jgi:hypothetical protein
MAKREKIKVASDFYGWGPKPGQKLAAEVIEHDDEGGETLDGDPVPQGRLRFLEDTVSYSDMGSAVEELKAGEEKSITYSQKNLCRKILKAKLEVGDRIWIGFIDLAKTSNGGMAKIYEVEVERKAASKNGEKPPPF